ncbi:MAG: phosphorylase kinase [Cyanobacteria bacterium QS_8_64_29]|nr:MAG: phosphorylase kinase [Cyanobacteria bacterium QS_8_64_29]
MPVVHNERLLDWLGTDYNAAGLQQLRAFLAHQGTLQFPSLPNGLFPAASVSSETAYTGYAHVWIRDNIHIAHAHHATGRTAVAARTLETLMAYWQKHRHRLDAIIAGRAHPQDPMARPQVRFDGRNLAELSQKWAHAQNDALGYFLWLYSTLAREGAITLSAEAAETLARFPPYLRAIQYWADQDSGHWEETPKIEASSIGTVLAGLKALQSLSDRGDCPQLDARELADLIARGEGALSEILPAECVQSHPSQYRRYDAALLFSIYPLQVVGTEMADRILEDVTTQLQGTYGIRRYRGDSYWCGDYKQKLAPEERTADFSDRIEARDALLAPGDEAQWCIFDPIVSTIYGRRYQAWGQPHDRERQIHYLNRALGQLTGPDSGFEALRCPELYHREGERYVPSDATPLLWTQGNLAVALEAMAQSVQEPE